MGEGKSPQSSESVDPETVAPPPPAPAAAAAAVSAQLLLVLVNVALYALAFMMQMPSQPFFVKRLLGEDSAAGAGAGASDAEATAAAARSFGLFKSYIQLLQLLGTLASGVLIDRMGARKLFALSFAVSALAYALTANADSLGVLYLAQLPTVLQHAMLGARAFVTRASADAGPERAQQMGLLKVAYGVGMTVGPVLGGRLVVYAGGGASARAMWLVSTTAAVLSAVSFVVVLLFLRDPGPAPVPAPAPAPAAAALAEPRLASAGASAAPAPAAPAAAAIVSAAAPSLADYQALASNRSVAALLALKLLFSAAGALFHGGFSSPAAIARFRLDPQRSGDLISLVGLVGGLTNFFLIAPAQARFSEPALLLATGAALVLLYSVFGAVADAQQLMLLCVPLVVCSSLLETVLSTQLTRLVPARLAGTSNALDMGVGTGVRMLSPVLSAALLVTSADGFPLLGAVCAALMLAFCVMLALAAPQAAAGLSPSASSVADVADGAGAGGGSAAAISGSEVALPREGEELRRRRSPPPADAGK